MTREKTQCVSMRVYDSVNCGEKMYRNKRVVTEVKRVGEQLWREMRVRAVGMLSSSSEHSACYTESRCVELIAVCSANPSQLRSALTKSEHCEQRAVRKTRRLDLT